MRAQPEVTRRQVLRTAAWATPVVALAVAAPMASASGGALAVTFSTTGLNGGGVDIYLGEGKTNNAAPATSSTIGNRLAHVTFVITDSVTGLPVSGATVLIAGDNLTDGNGNFVIGVWDTASTGAPTPPAFGESPVKRTATVTTDSLGRATAKISTATWSRDACAPGASGPFIPPSGTLTVTATLAGHTTLVQAYSYRVNDTTSPVTC